MLPKLLDLTGIEHDAKRFRINRDIRFSKDKTPYNTHLHISFKPRARLIPTWFFGLSPDYLTAGVGTFGFDKPQLEAYRKRIDSPHGDALAASLEDLTNKGARISEPELKRLPKGFDADHRHGPLLRRKSLAVWMDFRSANRRHLALHRPNLLSKIQRSNAGIQLAQSHLTTHIGA